MFFKPCQGKSPCFGMIVMVVKQNNHIQNGKLPDACQADLTGKAGALEC